MHEGALIGALLARIIRAPLVFDFQGGLSGEMVDHGFLILMALLTLLSAGWSKFICHLPDVILTSSLRAQGFLVDQFALREEDIVPLPDMRRHKSLRSQPCSISSEKQALREKLGIPRAADCGLFGSASRVSRYQPPD